MLHVVEDHQHPALPARIHDGLRGLRARVDAEGLNDSVGHQVVFADPGEVDVPDTIRELIERLRRDFGGEAGLADTARPSTVTRRSVTNSARTWATSSSRPMSGVGIDGR